MWSRAHIKMVFMTPQTFKNDVCVGVLASRPLPSLFSVSPCWQCRTAHSPALQTCGRVPTCRVLCKLHVVTNPAIPCC